MGLGQRDATLVGGASGGLTDGLGSPSADGGAKVAGSGLLAGGAIVSAVVVCSDPTRVSDDWRDGSKGGTVTRVAEVDSVSGSSGSSGAAGAGR